MQQQRIALKQLRIICGPNTHQDKQNITPCIRIECVCVLWKRWKVKLSLYLIKHDAKKTFEGVGGTGGKLIPSYLLTLALGGVEWSASRLSLSTTEDRAYGTQLNGGWMGARADLDAMEREKSLSLPGIELGSPSPYPIGYAY
jgi:hypothetical protein